MVFRLDKDALKKAARGKGDNGPEKTAAEFRDIPRASATPRERHDRWRHTGEELFSTRSPERAESDEGEERGQFAAELNELTAESVQQVAQRFRDKNFLDRFSAAIKEDEEVPKSLKKVSAVLDDLKKDISRLSEEQRTVAFNEYLDAQAGDGLEAPLRAGNPYAKAATLLASQDAIHKLDRIAREITDTDTGMLRATPIDVNAVEKAPILGRVQKVKGVIVPDLVTAALAASTTYSGILKSLSAGVSAAPSFNEWLIDKIGPQGVIATEQCVSGMIALAVAGGIVKGLKDPLREAAHNAPERNALLSAYQSNPRRFTVGVISAMAAAAFASHAMTSATIQSKIGASTGERVLEQLKPEFESIRLARERALQDLPDIIGTYFKGYINVEIGGQRNVGAGMTVQEKDLVNRMKWSFSPPAKEGAGPLTAAKRYFITRETTPKLTSQHKVIIDAQLQQLNVPEDKGYAWYATEVARQAMAPSAQSQEYASERLRSEVEILRTSTPVGHFLRELTVVKATTGQEVPNLLIALTKAKTDFGRSYEQFTRQTWEENVQRHFNDAMAAIGSKADKLDMKFPPLEQKNASLNIEIPTVTAWPFFYTQQEWDILGKATGFSFDSTQAKAEWNAGMALLYGTIDLGTVYPSMRLSRRRDEYFDLVEEERSKEIDELENRLARMITGYLNDSAHPAIEMLTGIELPTVSLSVVREKLYETAAEDRAVLEPAEKRGRLRNVGLFFHRLMQMSVRESVEKQVARADWYNEQLDRMRKDPEHVMDLIARMYPEFEAFKSMALAIAKKPRDIEKHGLAFITRMRTDAQSLAKSLYKDETTAESRKVAMLDAVLAQLASPRNIARLSREHPEFNTVESQLGRGVSILFDGKSAIELSDAEASYFFATAEIERMRKNAVDRLTTLMSQDALPEARAWAHGVMTGRRAVLPPSQADVRARVAAARRELGSDVDTLVADFERSTQTRALGIGPTDAPVDTRAVSEQLTAINRDAVSRIREMMAQQDRTRNPLRRGPEHEFVVSYGMDEQHGRPMLHVHMYDPEKQKNVSTITYPGLIPNLALKNTAALSEHIVEWYTLTGQYELAVKTMKLDTMQRWQELAARIKAQRPDMAVALSVGSPLPSQEELGTFVEYQKLGEMVAREEMQLQVLRSGKPLDMRELDIFDSSQIVLMSRSGVPESADRLVALFADITDALNEHGAADARVSYDIAQASFTVSDRSGPRSIPLRDVARGREVLGSA